jgi:hypothetical protein
MKINKKKLNFYFKQLLIKPKNKGFGFSKFDLNSGWL